MHNLQCTYFITIIPLLVAAGVSILSVPVPARPMMDKLEAAITSAVTFVADLTISPSCFCKQTFAKINLRADEYNKHLMLLQKKP